jgi:hypothetical protein
MVSTIVNSINTESSNVLTATGFVDKPGVLHIGASTPFYIGLCSEEVSLQCDDEICYPLSVKPIYNLADGQPGNETDFSLTCGLGFEVENSLETVPSSDLNRDGLIDARDLLLLRTSWGLTTVGDLNQNGITNYEDLWIFSRYWHH